MRFLADMNVDFRVVTWLRQQAHDAVHLRDEGLHRMRDQDIFSKAQSEGRVVLTFDLDFAEIAALTAGKGASVILFRLHNARTKNLIDRLTSVLATCTAALEAGAVVVVEDSRLRVRYLPIGETGGEL